MKTIKIKGFGGVIQEIEVADDDPRVLDHPESVVDTADDKKGDVK